MQIYVVRAGKHGEDESLALDNGLAIIGYQEIPDLTGLNSYEQVYKAVDEAYGANARTTGIRAGQLWRFSKLIKPGDIITIPLKSTSQVALGVVAGHYAYRVLNGEPRHVIPVDWKRVDVPRTAFAQDMLHSMGSLLTVSEIKRNAAVERFKTILRGGEDPGLKAPEAQAPGLPPPDAEGDDAVDLSERAQDEIQAWIRERFRGHDLARLVEAVLRAQGFTTEASPPGPDGGVDILAARGALGFDEPLMCVQVKATGAPISPDILRALVGTMNAFGASRGLLVSWGGFSRPTLLEAKQQYFTVRVWSAVDLIQAIYDNYDKLPEEIQAELPLKRIWVLVNEKD